MSDRAVTSEERHLEILEAISTSLMVIAAQLRILNRIAVAAGKYHFGGRFVEELKSGIGDEP